MRITERPSSLTSRSWHLARIFDPTCAVSCAWMQPTAFSSMEPLHGVRRIQPTGMAELRDRRFRRLTSRSRIAAYLDEQTAKIDALIAESERFIELARERRSALITAAVTGQIDVREMV